MIAPNAPGAPNHPRLMLCLQLRHSGRPLTSLGPRRISCHQEPFSSQRWAKLQETLGIIGENKAFTGRFSHQPFVTTVSQYFHYLSVLIIEVCIIHQDSQQ